MVLVVLVVLVVVGPALPVASLYYFYYYTGEQSGGWMGSVRHVGDGGQLVCAAFPTMRHQRLLARIEGHLHTGSPWTLVNTGCKIFGVFFSETLILLDAYSFVLPGNK